MPTNGSGHNCKYFQALQLGRELFSREAEATEKATIEELRKSITGHDVDEVFALLNSVSDTMQHVFKAGRLLLEENHQLTLQAKINLLRNAEFCQTMAEQAGEKQDADRFSAQVNDVSEWMALSIEYLNA